MILHKLFISFFKIRNIIILGFILRIFIVICYGNFEENYYWEYGEIAKNIIHGNGYSLFYIEDSHLEYHFKENAQPSKSADMPPGYVYFLLPFMLINNIIIRNALIFLIQAVLSSITIYLVYIFTEKMFGFKTALMSAFIYAVLPEFLYTVLSYSPTVLYHLFILLLLIRCIDINVKNKSYIQLAILIAVLIYLRSEFVLYFIILVVLFLSRKKLKFAIKVFIMVVIFILPWSIRNYLAFGEVVPISTSFGLNFYRGNNQYGIGAWTNNDIEKEVNSLSKDNLEIEMSKYYLKDAISFIEKNPYVVIKNLFLKIFYFWFYYPMDKRTLNLFYLIPSLIVLIFFVFGIMKSFNWKRYDIIYLFFIFSSIIALIFFPMVRYQTMMKIAMVPFCSFGMYKFYELNLRK